MMAFVANTREDDEGVRARLSMVVLQRPNMMLFHSMTENLPFSNNSKETVRRLNVRC